MNEVNSEEQAMVAAIDSPAGRGGRGGAAAPVQVKIVWDGIDRRITQLTRMPGSVSFVTPAPDSRTYLLRNGQLTPITKDHSLVARLVEAKQIEPEDIYTHPQRNLIYRSLGAGHKTIEVDIFHQTLKPGDTLLLCSDGLWEMVRSEDLLKELSEKTSPQKICDTLIDLANANGGEDNITAVVVHISAL